MDELFTLKSARRILPEVRARLGEAMRAHADLESVRAEIREFAARVQEMGGMELHGEVSGHWHRNLRRAEAMLQSSFESLAALGVQVKDLETGLVDFPTVYRGRDVLLCWKMGEPDIAWWHGAEEGFLGRKPIDEDFELNHGPGENPAA
jgi:hypothetical protein